jgi:hypothetical protein
VVAEEVLDLYHSGKKRTVAGRRDVCDLAELSVAQLEDEIATMARSWPSATETSKPCAWDASAGRSPLTEREAVMVRLFVRINVADYETWRKVYDQFYGERVAMGVMGAAAFQLVDDPNDVTVWHDFETAEVARAFVSSDPLRNVMQRAGVQGEPQIWFTTESWRPAPSFASSL